MVVAATAAAMAAETAEEMVAVMVAVGTAEAKAEVTVGAAMAAAAMEVAEWRWRRWRWQNDELRWVTDWRTGGRWLCRWLLVAEAHHGLRRRVVATVVGGKHSQSVTLSCSSKVMEAVDRADRNGGVE